MRAMQTEALPTPAEIDELAIEYLELNKKAVDAALAATAAVQLARDKGEVLREMVGRAGSAHAAKSKILFGVEFEAMCTYAQSSSVDSAAVETFRRELKKSAKSRIISKIFERTVRWTLRAEASDVIRGSRLSEKLSSLWAKCIVLTDKTPKLDVRPRKKAA